MADLETVTREPIDLNARLLAITHKIVDVAGGAVRLAHNEEDDTPDAQPEAAHFLKVGERRLGRDLELYGLMGRLGTKGYAVVSFLGEVAMPLQSTLDAESYAAVMADVEQLGAEVFPEDMLDSWHELFEA